MSINLNGRRFVPQSEEARQIIEEWKTDARWHERTSHSPQSCSRRCERILTHPFFVKTVCFTASLTTTASTFANRLLTSSDDSNEMPSGYSWVSLCVFGLLTFAYGSGLHEHYELQRSISGLKVVDLLRRQGVAGFQLLKEDSPEFGQALEQPCLVIDTSSEPPKMQNTNLFPAQPLTF